MAHRSEREKTKLSQLIKRREAPFAESPGESINIIENKRNKEKPKQTKPRQPTTKQGLCARFTIPEAETGGSL